MTLDNFIYEQYNGGINLIDFKDEFKNQVEELIIPNEWNVVAITKKDFYSTDPFNSCNKLKKVVLPSTLKEINDAFCSCNNLKEVIFPENLEILGNWNFRDCEKFETVTLPSNLKRIGFGNFGDSPVLLSEYGEEGDGCVYLGNYLLKCLVNDFGTFEIREGTVLIADCAFSDKRFSKIIFPNSLKYIGSQAFYCCNNMEKPILPDSVVWIGDEAFYTTNGDLVESCFVTDGKIDENGRIVLEKELGYISKNQLQKAVEKLDGYLLKVSYDSESSYDNSDDDRVEDSSSSYSSYSYKELNPLKNTKSLLRINNEIVGVVFRARPNSNKEPRLCPFLFDNSIKRSMTLGYSASHSSNYVTVTKVELVKKGENGAPLEGAYINFEPSEISTSI